MQKAIAALLTATTLSFGLPAVAQTLQTGEIIALDDWNEDELYTAGLSVDRMMDEFEVYGPTGNGIGSVENVLIGADGRAVSIIAQVGGFWDIGDTHVNVPWTEIQIDRSGRVVLPITEETIEDYSDFSREFISAAGATGSIQAVEDDANTAGQLWRATDLMGDFARLREGEGYLNYGYVRDLIIRDGQVAAVVVEPGGEIWKDRVYDGPYAYPFFSTEGSWTPGAPTYDLPYSRDEIADREPFDYRRFETGN